MAGGPSIIANERDDDTSLTGMILNVLHVGAVWEVIITTASTGVLVLRLVKNDRTTIGNLCFGNGGSNVGGIAKRNCQNSESQSRSR